jgi:hypothetical protein
MKSVMLDGIALNYAAATLKSDKEVVLQAVNQNGDAIKFISEDLKNDKDVALAAVTNKPMALKYVKKEGWKPEDFETILMKAIKQYNSIPALLYAVEEKLIDPEYPVTKWLDFEKNGFSSYLQRLSDIHRKDRSWASKKMG